MGKVGSPAPHPGPKGLDQTQDLQPYHTSTGAVRVGAPCWAVGHLANRAPRLPCPHQAVLQAGCGFGLLG